MSTNTPFARLISTWTIYLAPAGEAKPVVSATPAGNWVVLGPTDGEQSVQNMGKLAFLRDNDHQGPVKSVRGDEDVKARFNLVGLTQENYAKILHDASNVAADAGPPASKAIPFKRGNEPTEYALLMKGALDSPYGAFPGQIYIPRCVDDSEPQMVRSRSGSPALACEFVALEDDTEASGDEMGVWEVQTA
jgi:hypothetical protein